MLVPAAVLTLVREDRPTLVPAAVLTLVRGDRPTLVPAAVLTLVRGDPPTLVPAAVLTLVREDLATLVPAAALTLVREDPPTLVPGVGAVFHQIVANEISALVTEARLHSWGVWLNAQMGRGAVGNRDHWGCRALRGGSQYVQFPSSRAEAALYGATGNGRGAVR
jgi:hypothetical protein